MKNFMLSLLIILPLFAATQNHLSKNFQAIHAAMQAQETAWNQGDIELFMQYYWQSDSLQFVGANGPTYGWQTTLDNYKRRYPNKMAMGILHFDILNMNCRSKRVISVLGKFTLERAHDRPEGYFLLIWQKIKGRWVIVADFTG